MKEGNCFICKFVGKLIPTYKRDHIWDHKGNTIAIPLCDLHSCELFKAGQRVFIKRYKQIFETHVSLSTSLDLKSYNKE